MQGIGYEVGELRIRAGGSGRVLRTHKQMRDKSSIQAGRVLMAIVGISFDPA